MSLPHTPHNTRQLLSHYISLFAAISQNVFYFPSLTLNPNKQTEDGSSLFSSRSSGTKVKLRWWINFDSVCIGFCSWLVASHDLLKCTYGCYMSGFRAPHYLIESQCLYGLYACVREYSKLGSFVLVRVWFRVAFISWNWVRVTRYLLVGGRLISWLGWILVLVFILVYVHIRVSGSIDRFV